MSIILDESLDFCTFDRARVLPVFIGASVRLQGRRSARQGVDSCQGYNAVAHGSCHDPDPMPSGLAKSGYGRVAVQLRPGNGSCAASRAFLINAVKRR
jgi:hypothetical protein